MTMTLAECPIGLFFSASGELCLKTEYGSNEGRIDAYIVSSGEFFWGSWPQTIESQRAQIVRPVDAAALTAALEGREEPSQDYRLPCDVRLPPYTTIRKGCTLDTLMLSLGQREGRPSSDTTFPPPPDIARIRAEAVAQERERCARAAYDAALYSGCPSDQIAQEIADAIRGGAE